MVKPLSLSIPPFSDLDEEVLSIMFREKKRGKEEGKVRSARGKSEREEKFGRRETFGAKEMRCRDQGGFPTLARMRKTAPARSERGTSPHQ